MQQEQRSGLGHDGSYLDLQCTGVPVSACKSVCDGCLLGCPLLREHRGAGPANAVRANHGCQPLPRLDSRLHRWRAPPRVGHLASRNAASPLLPHDPGEPSRETSNSSPVDLFAGAAPGPIGGSARAEAARASRQGAAALPGHRNDLHTGGLRPPDAAADRA
jgi:hypothetical protein